jgi:hypothetical protein
MTIKHYEVQTRTVADGWINTWHEDDCPLVFATEHAARKALSEFFDDLKEAQMDEAYSLIDYRVAAVNFEDLLTLDESDTPATMAAKIQRAISTKELRDLIDELAELYEPTEDMELAEDTEAYDDRLYPSCFSESAEDLLKAAMAQIETNPRGTVPALSYAISRANRKAGK